MNRRQHCSCEAMRGGRRIQCVCCSGLESLSLASHTKGPTRVRVPGHALRAINKRTTPSNCQCSAGTAIASLLHTTSVIDSATSRPCLTRKVEQQIRRRGIKKYKNATCPLLFSLPFAKTLLRTHSFEQFHPHPHVCDDGRSSNAATKGGKESPEEARGREDG